MSAAPAAPGHVPVLLKEAMEALDPRAGGVYLDGTFGGGGYARALLDLGVRVIALDRDPTAIRAGEALRGSSGGRLELVEARFADLNEVVRRLSVDAVDGIVLDIGVSSMQLDEASRGFSLRFDAPLDMRMGSGGRSAADILRDDDEATIADILFHFGEERAARRIARAIVADRETKPFTSTLELAGMIARVAPARRGELTHPATRAFQALRIAVNDELGELVRGLCAAECQTRRPRCGCDIPLARGPDRQTVPREPFRSRTSDLAPLTWRTGRGRADIRGSARPANRAERSGDACKSSRALGEIAIWRPLERAAAGAGRGN
jgi:16S rRNA (cytosine1402-N4)-methyltransferase